MQQAIQDATSTPGQRAKDWITLQLAKIGVGIILIWIVFHLDEIIDWWNGK